MTITSLKTLAKKSPSPMLCFDQDAIQGFMRQMKLLGKKYRVEFLSPMKSFPHPTMFKMVASSLSGFDVSNPVELKQALKYSAAIYSLDWKSQPWRKGLLPKSHRASQFLASTEDFSVFEKMGEEPRLRRGLRLDPFSIIPARLCRSLAPSSRFGRSSHEVISFLRTAKPDRFGLHLHLGSEKNKTEHYLAMARGACEIAKKSGCRLDYLNLGGGLASFDLQSLEQLLIQLRKGVPKSVQLIFEPGRLFSERFGYALGRVESIIHTGLATQYRLNLSQECHLRWGRPVLCEIPVATKKKMKTHFLFAGPSSLESDKILQIEILQGILSLQVGDPVIFGHIAGYCVAWNRSFNGIPAAKIQFV